MWVPHLCKAQSYLSTECARFLAGTQATHSEAERSSVGPGLEGAPLNDLLDLSQAGMNDVDATPGMQGHQNSLFLRLFRTRPPDICKQGVTTMPDAQFSRLIAGCQNLRSLYIAKCHIYNVAVALPRLELLSVTHCRQLTDQCASEMLNPANNPSLRFLDLTEDRGLASPTIAHPGLEIAWLMHCPQLTDQVVANMFQSCTSLSAANLVQSSIETAFICSPTLRTLELTTSQKLTDDVVTKLLQYCPSLSLLDVGHCCQLSEPEFAHATLETILLSFCVNLRESAIVGLFANCPSLRYVELAVCMFDMTRFQRESPKCQVVVNFDF